MKQCPEDACQALSQVVELVERDAPRTTLESAALDLLSILAHTDCRVRTSSEARLRTGQLCDRLAQHLALLGSVQMACELTDWHAKLLQDTKQPKAALRLMTSWFKSIELKHGSPEILLRYASLLVAKKRYADAYPVACAAVENCRIMECTSILPIALHTYAVVLEGNRNFERAEDVYREAFEEAKNVDIKLAVKFKQSLRECKEANRVKNRSLGQRKKKMKKMKFPSKTESNTVKRKSSTKEPEGSILHAFCHQQQGQQDVLDAWMSETYQGYHRGQILNLTSSSQSGSEEDSSQPQRYFVIPDQLEQMSSEFSNCSTPDSNVLQSENTTLGPKHPQSSACNYLSSPFGFEEKEMKEVRNQAMNENIYCSNAGDQGKISISNSTKVLFKTATRPTAQSHYSVCCQKTILVPEHSHQPEQKENHIEVPLYRGAQERYEHERSPISPDVRNLMYSEQTFTTSSSPISSGLSSSSLSSSSTEPSSSSLSSSSTEPSSSSLSLRSTEPSSSSSSSSSTEPSSSSSSSSSIEPSSSSLSSSSTEPSSSSSSSSSTEPSSSSSSSSSTEPSSSSLSLRSTEPSSSSLSSSSTEPSSSSLSSSSTEPPSSSSSSSSTEPSSSSSSSSSTEPSSSSSSSSSTEPSSSSLSSTPTEPSSSSLSSSSTEPSSSSLSSSSTEPSSSSSSSSSTEPSSSSSSSSSIEPSSSSLSSSSTELSSSSLSLRSTEPSSSSLSSSSTEPSSSSLSSSSTEPSSSSSSSSSTEPSSSSSSSSSTEPSSSSSSSSSTEPSSSSLSLRSTEPSSSSLSSSSTEPSSSSLSSSSTEPPSSSSSSSSTEPSSSSSSSSSTEPSNSSSSSSSIEPSSSSLSSSSTEPFNSSQSTRNYKDASGPTSLASSSELSASSLNSRCISSSSPSPRFENSANILFATSSNHASSSSQHLIQAGILSSSLSSSYDDVSSSSQSSSQLLPRTNKAVDFSSPCSKEGFCCCSCSYEEVETVAAEVKNTQRLPVIVRLNEHPVSSFQSVHSTPSLGSSSSRSSQGLRCDLSSEPCAKSTRPLERSQVTTKSQVPHLDFSKLSKSSPLLFAPKMCPPESHTVRSSSACSDLVEQSSMVGLLSNSYTNRSYKQASRAKIPRTKTLWPPGMKVKPLF